MATNSGAGFGAVEAETHFLDCIGLVGTDLVIGWALFGEVEGIMRGCDADRFFLLRLGDAELLTLEATFNDMVEVAISVFLDPLAFSLLGEILDFAVMAVADMDFLSFGSVGLTLAEVSKDTMGVFRLSLP